jgi:hypothetical protein
MYDQYKPSRYSILKNAQYFQTESRVLCFRFKGDFLGIVYFFDHFIEDVARNQLHLW